MAYDPTIGFDARVATLPRLGLGISTEFGAAALGLDALALRRDRPDLLQFLEVGVDLDRGVDADARAWAASGAPTTYHFLDLNLEERDDLDPDWIVAAGALARSLGAAWLCGDAGLWHVGPRERGHGVLLPPVLTEVSARELAHNVRALRVATGMEVLPENPPAHVYVGDLHLLDYFARVAERADAGLLLDVAHLAIYQRATGHAPGDGLDGFPLDRVVEVHVAGGTEFAQGGRRFVDDDHAPEPLPEVWPLLERILPRAPNLRAVVYECERNPRHAVLANFERLRAMLDSRCEAKPKSDTGERREPPCIDVDVRRIQRTLVRMHFDAGFADRMHSGDAEAIASASLGAVEAAWLRALDPVAVVADRDGRRAAQLLRNVDSEFQLCAAVGPAGDGDASFVAAFPRSPHFHAAIARDESLPLAFAAFAEAIAADAPSRLFRALVALEAAMTRARRIAADPRTPARGALQRAATACVVELPAGTHAAATQLRDRTPHGLASKPPPELDSADREFVLIAADATADARFGRLRPLRVEPLAAPVAAFLQRAELALDRSAQESFAAECGVELDELDAVVDEFVAEGVLLRGSDAP